MQRIVGQPKSGFNPRTIMDGRKILIANLDIGQIGEENVQLLGALLITKFELAARARSETSGTAFPDHYLNVDEFRRFPNGLPPWEWLSRTFGAGEAVREP
jgi:hypothetical protein